MWENGWKVRFYANACGRIDLWVTVQPRTLHLLQSPYQCVNATRNPAFCRRQNSKWTDFVTGKPKG